MPKPRRQACASGQLQRRHGVHRSPYRRGRGPKVAIHTADSSVSYAELAANVDRCANALVRLAQARRAPVDGGERLPGLLLSVLGRDQGWHRAGAAQYVAALVELRLHDRRFRRRRAGLFAGIRRRGRTRARRCQAAATYLAAHRGRRRLARRAAPAEPAALCRRAGQRRRRLLLALFVRLDRLAERRGASPSRHGRHQPTLWRRDAGHSRGRHLLFRGQAVLRLWAR